MCFAVCAWYLEETENLHEVPEAVYEEWKSSGLVEACIAEKPLVFSIYQSNFVRWKAMFG